MADRVGQHFGNYRLVRLLGQGSFAEVYLGQHVRLELQAAIKVLHTHLTEQEAEHFQQEAQTIVKLIHPAIVRVFDFDVQEGVPFLVMEYAPNGSLRRRYPKGEVAPLPTLIPYLKQVAEALQYAHEQKFIHRDVKPENMLLGRRQEVLLSDFGIATIAQSTSSLSASTQGTSGTIAYMAPEQIEGHPRAASDQYALGVVVYEWLCGSRPFEGSPTEVMVQQLTMPPPPLRDRVPTVPIEVEQVVLKALAKDPKARFASVADFASALEQASTAYASGQTLPLLASGYTTVAELRWSSLHDLQPLRTFDTSPNNLPVQPTPLVGRVREVGAVCELMRRDEVRLVTLTGPGGIGKTRLGLQVAAELSESFADGVFFVDLAPLSLPSLVIDAIAQTLCIQEVVGQTLLDRLKEHLQQQQQLLLLDNFEQVLSAASQVADLLAACPRLKVLVTSRERLYVRAEHEFAVPPLDVPDPNHLPELAALAQSEAVALFLQRAQTTKLDFKLTPANAQAIAEICIRLDGLPLAIELAAARIKVLPPQALLARLGQRLAVLTSGARDAPARQQTLRNTIEWSYQLLDASEQRLFRRLSVFVGGCTLEVAEAVYGSLEDGVGWILDGVASLLDKSLLKQIEQEEEEPRIMMLETIHEYGLECLATSGETEAARQAHAMYYLSLAETFEPEFGGPQQIISTIRLERERENLRAALYWLIEHEERESALRLSGALWRFWRVRGPVREGLDWLERALGGSDGVQTSVRAKALYASGELALLVGDVGRAAAWGEESLLLYRALGDKRGIAASLMLLGQAASVKGNFVAAHTLHEESLALRRGLEDREGIADSLVHQGWLSFMRGDIVKAGEQYQESLQIFRDLGNREAIETVLASLGHVATFRGEYARAHALAQESLELSRELGDRVGIVESLFSLARVAFLQNDLAQVPPPLEESLALAREVGDKLSLAYSLNLLGEFILCQSDSARARSLLEESLELFKGAGLWRGMNLSLILLARVEAHRGDHVLARALYEESLEIAREMNNKLNIVDCLEGLAGVVAAQGELTWGARLWGAAEALRDAMGTPIPPVYRVDYERSVTAACTQLGEKVFAEAWAEGRTMTPEQALAAKGTVTMLMASPVEPSMASFAPKAPTYPDGLTAREVEVLRLVAQGLTNEQVAEQLVISPRTVNTHLTSIFSKIVVSSRSAATRYAIEHHLIRCL